MGPRSFDLLLQLLKRAGEFVSKEGLLATVWAGLVVEEGSVRVHMSTLRKALGEPGAGEECHEWISTLPQRGYRFNGRVRRDHTGAIEAVTQPCAPPLSKLPLRLTELVGRDADLDRALAALSEHRLVTIVGSGGIGKTSAAIRAAECRQETQPGLEVAFIDLSSTISQDRVLGIVARAVGVADDLPNPVQAVVQALQGRSVLLLIDNCEHVVESLAQPIIGLLTALPDLCILATSREPIRVTGECVLRLSALAIPDSEDLTLEQAMRWPAVHLLLDRAKAAGAGAFHELHGPLLARMARQLDGIPLAIELVAARLGVQSISDLASRLDDHMRLHTAGNRTAAPRHRTLAAALKWSIELLAHEELRLLRRLSILRGRFDVESALRINAEVDPDATFSALLSLADKSLVSFDTKESAAPYRLLDTTRSYAASLLVQSGEHLEVWARHVKALDADHGRPSPCARRCRTPRPSARK
ncbi:winged helix-turn-helix domain-containing protein [Variovorax sp. J22R115]|nr:winged helix-turn-helix domain-containing protein [Variovorax sp. J22R115]